MLMIDVDRYIAPCAVIVTSQFEGIYTYLSCKVGFCTFILRKLQHMVVTLYCVVIATMALMMKLKSIIFGSLKGLVNWVESQNMKLYRTDTFI